VLVVIDTNILVSGLQSSLGASNEVLRRLALGHFRAAVSTTLLFEYEDVLHGLVSSLAIQDLRLTLFSTHFVAEPRRR
jgi:predicted nucleic acid-binding protein